MAGLYVELLTETETTYPGTDLVLVYIVKGFRGLQLLFRVRPEVWNPGWFTALIELDVDECVLEGMHRVFVGDPMLAGGPVDLNTRFILLGRVMIWSDALAWARWTDDDAVHLQRRTNRER